MDVTDYTRDSCFARSLLSVPVLAVTIGQESPGVSAWRSKIGGPRAGLGDGQAPLLGLNSLIRWDIPSFNVIILPDSGAPELFRPQRALCSSPWRTIGLAQSFRLPGEPPPRENPVLSLGSLRYHRGVKLSITFLDISLLGPSLAFPPGQRGFLTRSTSTSNVFHIL